MDEPELVFGYGQTTIDPRDGLTLFGPYSRGNVKSIVLGIIGTSEGIEHVKNWLINLRRPKQSKDRDIARPYFPGFETAFEAEINYSALQIIRVDDRKIEHYLNYSDTHQRIYNLVSLYADKLIDYSNEEEVPVHCWIVVIPDMVYRYGRPTISIPITEGTIRDGLRSKSLKTQPVLFDGLREDQKPYEYEKHFHDQLKARILSDKIVVQILRESTIAYDKIKKPSGELLRDLTKFQTAIDWNLSTALYYKSGGIPWKLGCVRDGVCYVGLVYKRMDYAPHPNYACCAAQMFLDSGDGLVFRGNNGPWFNENKRQYHLSKESAFDLLERSLQAFYNKNLTYPKEVFVHARSSFEEEEWQGFFEACKGKSTIVGVSIREEGVFKLYRQYRYPVLRGMMYPLDISNAFLFTRGFIPRINTQLGLETPNPLSVKVCRGEADLETVCNDILSLTKLNYNSCIFCDGKPVTLRFADMIGNVLTAGPIEADSALPFKHYI